MEERSNKQRRERYLKALMRGLRRRKLQRNLVGDANAVAFQRDHILRVVGDHANIFEAEVNQHLRADAALVLHHALARRLAIELPARVEMNLGQGAGSFRRVDSVAAASMMEIQEDAAIFLSNFLQ